MTILSRNPVNGEVLAAYESLSDEQLEQKLGRSAATFAEWRRTEFQLRARLMHRAADLLEQRKEEIGRMMTLEMGKPIRAAMDEAGKCAWACRYYADNAEQFLADEEIQAPPGRSFVAWQPIGAVLAVMPWNYPFWQVVRFAAPALMAGNVCLLKHASNVPRSALALEDLFLEAGFPAGAFQTLLIGASKVDSVLDDPRVAAATLTGSEGAGIQVGISAAKRIKKIVLELGGSDPFIVMRSAELDQAVATAVKARIANNGQSCIAAKRFLVHEAVADQFERQFVQRMEALKVGDPLNAETELGPLASREAAKELHAQVEASVSLGARVLTGGQLIPGRESFYPPTVLVDVPPGSPAYSEEFFGPVACLFRVKDAADAIRIANATRFGLGASVWTKDAAERDLFIRELQSGMVFINKMVASDPRIPFGGVKQSGFGRELGPWGIREFCNLKTVCIEQDQ
ncbi:MAG TPA: NAD-dependent succinate-semialdehyde dehydrogenase [Acidobacteriaceae bacterium]|jgi:succinate-semialdehyde dehydrogenase/glutarate-semialdehyde dehydrogenase|nr:NAD-dependent succinate-semialdehyde dehydrogenase [Acidobacteriaceae bacterium]